MLLRFTHLLRDGQIQKMTVKWHHVFIAVRVANPSIKVGYIVSVKHMNVMLCHSVSGLEILKECGAFIFRDLRLLNSWTWRHCVCLMCQEPLTEQRSATSHETRMLSSVLLLFTVVTDMFCLENNCQKYCTWIK